MVFANIRLNHCPGGAGTVFTDENIAVCKGSRQSCSGGGLSTGARTETAIPRGPDGSTGPAVRTRETESDFGKAVIADSVPDNGSPDRLVPFEDQYFDVAVNLHYAAQIERSR